MKCKHCGEEIWLGLPRGPWYHEGGFRECSCAEPASEPDQVAGDRETVEKTLKSDFQFHWSTDALDALARLVLRATDGLEP